MDDLSVSIIGLGPRGLITLSEIITQYKNAERIGPLTVNIITPEAPGEGAHPSGQPDYLFTNTLASQVTMFPLKSGKSGFDGPSFTEWVIEQGYRRVGDKYVNSGPDQGVPISDLDYLPRSLLGKYLNWVYRYVTADLPSGLEVAHHCALAEDITKRDNGTFTVLLDNGKRISSSHIFLSTGHSNNKPDSLDKERFDFVERQQARTKPPEYIRNIYPVSLLDGVESDSVVAIQGLGLTAWDAIAELTEGRGGRYQGSGDDLTYKLSGTEPKILLFSRQCLPSAARGINQKGLIGRHQAKFFTVEKIEELRRETLEETGTDKLDFEIQVLPLLKKEIAYAYRLCATQQHIDPGSFEISAKEEAIIAEAFDPLAGQVFQTFDEYRAFFVDMVSQDLISAKKGNLTAPIKAATDVIRDTRAALCTAVEHHGLTGRSHQWFLSKIVPLMNRIAYGPPRFRSVQLLALMQAGVLDLAGGPGNRVILDEERGRFVVKTRFARQECETSARYLIVARLDPFLPEQDDRPLTQSLLKSGIARPARNDGFLVGGYDVDRSNRLRSGDDEKPQNIWASGYPIEGPQFYTHALPRTGLKSRQFDEVENSIREIFEHHMNIQKEAPSDGRHAA